jgi:drug/metabolite transporter (DMT)-like permease
VLAILLSLVSAIGYGGSDYAAGLAAREASVIRVTIVAEAASVVALLLVVPWVSTEPTTPASAIWSVAGGLAGIGGAMALYMGFRQAAFSVAAPVSAVATAGFSVLAGLLFGEHPSGLSLTGIALALPAIVGVSASPGAPESPPGQPDSGQPDSGHSGRHAAGVMWGLAAGAGFAVLFIGLNRAGSSRDLWPLVIAQGTGLTAVVAAGVARGDVRLPSPRASGLAVVTGLTGAGGTLCYFIATHAGLLAVTAVITSLYPASTILLARILLGERLTMIRVAGLVLAAASVGLIAVGGAG